MVLLMLAFRIFFTIHSSKHPPDQRMHCTAGNIPTGHCNCVQESEANPTVSLLVLKYTYFMWYWAISEVPCSRHKIVHSVILFFDMLNIMIMTTEISVKRIQDIMHIHTYFFLLDMTHADTLYFESSGRSLDTRTSVGPCSATDQTGKTIRTNSHTQAVYQYTPWTRLLYRQTITL